MPDEEKTTDASTEATKTPNTDASAPKEATADAEATAEETTEATAEASTDTETPDESAAAEASSDDTADDTSADAAPEADATEADASDAEAEAEEAEADTNGSPEHEVAIEELLKAGTHFGHLTSRWNPKMKSFIFMERNGIHVIDLMQTQVLLDRAAAAAERFARSGKTIMFVGTKKQARDIVRQKAEDANCPYVVERWLGGMMTNFETMRLSIRRMEQLERMEDDGTFEQLKKKERLTKIREREKLERNLGGIRHMARLPGAIFIVDVAREHIAVNEAIKLDIPIIAMTDTNCDPGPIDFPIPANDDALKSIGLVTSVISEAVQRGQAQKQAQDQAKKQEKQKQKQKG